MIKFRCKIDIQAARASLKGLEKEVSKAAARALNRAADSVKVTAVKEIAAATKIKQKDVRPRIRVRGANPGYLIAEVEAYPYSPNLKAFRATQNKRGVAASAWEGRKTYRHAFVMPSGRVVTRTTNQRFPLKGLRGPSVPATFLRPKVSSAMMSTAERRFRAEFAREIERRTSR
jgi:hypothetical protein